MAVLKYKDPGTGQWIPIVPAGPPIGAILWWANSGTIPAGWCYCDGSAHNSSALQAVLGSAYTPDLRNRFIVGAGSSYARNATGGAETVTLTSSNTGVQSHAHGASAGNNNINHTHPLFLTGGGSHSHGTDFTFHYLEPTNLSDDTGDGYVLLQNPYSAPPPTEQAAGTHTHNGATGGVSHDHAHAVTPANSTAANASAAHENMPSYYALVYIIRAS